MPRYLRFWLSFWLSALWLLQSWAFQRDSPGSQVSYCRYDEQPLRQPALLRSRPSWWVPASHGVACAICSGGMALCAAALGRMCFVSAEVQSPVESQCQWSCDYSIVDRDGGQFVCYRQCCLRTGHVGWCRCWRCARNKTPRQLPTAPLLSRLAWWVPAPHRLARAISSGGRALRVTACRVLSRLHVSGCSLHFGWIPSGQTPRDSLFYGGYSSYYSYYRTYQCGISVSGFMRLCSVGLWLLWVYARLDSIFCVASLARIMWRYYLGWVLASMVTSNWRTLLRLCSRGLGHLGYCLLLVLGACRRVSLTVPLTRPRKSRTAWLMVLLLFLSRSEASCPRNGGGAAGQDGFMLPSSSPTRLGGEPIAGGRAGSWSLPPTRAKHKSGSRRRWSRRSGFLASSKSRRAVSTTRSRGRQPPSLCAATSLVQRRARKFKLLQPTSKKKAVGQGVRKFKKLLPTPKKKGAGKPESIERVCDDDLEELWKQKPASSGDPPWSHLDHIGQAQSIAGSSSDAGATSSVSPRPWEHLVADPEAVGRLWPTSCSCPADAPRVEDEQFDRLGICTICGLPFAAEDDDEGSWQSDEPSPLADQLDSVDSTFARTVARQMQTCERESRACEGKGAAKDKMDDKKGGE